MIAFFQHKNKSRLYPIHTLDFPAHLHRAVEFGFLEDGCGKISVEGKEFSLEAGDAFIVFPDKVHLFENCVGIRGYLGHALPDEFSIFTKAFSDALPASPVVKKALLREAGVDTLFRTAVNDPDLEEEGVLHGYLSLLMGKLLPLLPRDRGKNHKGEELNRVLLYLEQNFRENLSRRSVAREMGISESTLSHLFSASLHLSLPAYLNLLRLEEAQRLLSETALSVTAVASAAGFSSLRSMDRAFRKSLGKSPTAYRHAVTTGSQRQKNDQ